MSVRKASIEEIRRQGSVTAVELTDAHGRRRTINVSELDESDLALAEQFGYHPVFKREFGYLSAFSFAVSISGLFSTVVTTMYYPLLAGGASSIVWCWLLSGAGCMCIALSVSELVSAYPTCGGLYYTISRMAPKAWVPSISWYVGWLNLLGQVAGVASSEYGAAQMLLAAVSLGTGYNADLQAFNYSPTAGHTIAVMAALTIVCGAVNSMSTYWLEKMTKTYVIFHVAVLVSCCIALLVKTEDKHTAAYVFGDITNQSGWEPTGWAWLFGTLSVSWTMTDYDATAHIAEEIDRANIVAPWAISMAMLFTYVAGFLLNIVLAYCMGDPVELLGSSLGQPVVQLFYNSLGQQGAIAFTVFAFIIIQFVCWTAMQALGRTVFAFSRDNLLPLSRVWTKVSSVTGTPLYAVWISTFFCIIINLVGLGSYAAISGVFGITAIALDWSYVIPILCKMVWHENFEPGPWHLGKFGYFVNAYASIWTLFVSIIFIQPTIIPVTPENMNYAIVFFAFIIVVAAVWWFIRGRKVYTGPIAQANIDSIDGGMMTDDKGEKIERSSDSSQDHMDRKA